MIKSAKILVLDKDENVLEEYSPYLTPRAKKTEASALRAIAGFALTSILIDFPSNWNKIEIELTKGEPQ
jgi:hypothetical protein